jgi:DNA-directed RNA polymerase specialized sigma24 family protein
MTTTEVTELSHREIADVLDLSASPLHREAARRLRILSAYENYTEALSAHHTASMAKLSGNLMLETLFDNR